MTLRIAPLVGIGTYEYELDTRRLVWSDELCRICGVDPATHAVNVDLPWEICHPDDRETLRAAAAEAIAAGTAEFQYRVIRPDGEVRRLFARANLVRTDRGEPSRIVGFVVDVSEQREVEASLRRSEERYRSLAEAITQVIWVGTLAGEVTELSDSFSTITGHPKEAALGRGFLDLIPTEDVDAFRADWAVALANNQSFEAEYRMRRPDGGFLTFRSRSVVVFDEAGRARERVGTLTDVTHVKEAELSRRASAALFEKWFHTSPTALCLRRLDTQTILEVNDAWVALSGYTRDEVVGRTIDQSTWVDTARAQQLVDHLLATGRVTEQRALFRRKSGETRSVLVWAEPAEVGAVSCALISIYDITDRDQAEAARRASEELFFKAFNQSPVAMAIRDIDPQPRRLLQCNDAYCELTGYTREEAIGREPHEYELWLNQKELFDALAAEFVRDGRVRGMQAQLKRKPGEIRTVQIGAESIEVQGRTCALVTLVDLTPRVKAEARLAESEERLRRLSEAAWEGIGLTEQGVLIDVNDQLAEIMGYEPNELIGRSVADLVPLDSLRVVRDHIDRASEEPYEHKAFRKDGSIVTVEARGRTVPYDGRLIRMTAIRDLSERKRSEESRRALLAGTAGVLGADFFRTLVRQLSIALKVKCAFAGELLAPANDRVRALTMWVGDGYAEPFEFGLEGTPSAEVIADGTKFYLDDVQQRFPNDALLIDRNVVSYLGVPLFNTARQPIGVLSISHDAPLHLNDDMLSILSVFAARAGAELERIHAEEQVRRLNAELEQRVADRTAELEATNRELEAFTYSVSHDLRAPLRHVSGFVTLLEHEAGASLSGLAREYIDEVADSASKMGVLIDSLLEFSRIGRAALHPADVELIPVVRDVIAEVERDAGGRRIEWIVGPLPRVRCDGGFIRQAFVNVLANAVKYTRPRSVARIEIGRLPADDPSEVICFVRDNGVGFDMRHAGKLFGVFQRLHSVSAFEGTGIGLANVQRIIERHGGRVWATGAVDLGATIYFSLPSASEPPGAALDAGVQRSVVR